MRHRKRSCKLGRTTSHRRCMFANMLKSLVVNGRIETTEAKAKELRRHADKLVTLAKKDTLATRRKAIADLMIRYNTLTPKQKREAKNGNVSSYNTDRLVEKKLFSEMKTRYSERQGGYTRIIKMPNFRVGDGTSMCILEYVQ